MSIYYEPWKGRHYATGKPANLMNRRAFWHAVSFYNYLQEPMEGPRMRPRNQLWEEAPQPFQEVLDRLKPDHILVLGQRLWEHLPDHGRPGPTISLKIGMRDTWYYPVGGKNQVAIATWVYHPSTPQGSSIAQSHPYIAKLLRLRPPAA